MIGITNATSRIIARIIVSYPSGSICSCTNGSITYTAQDTSGACVFYIKSIGDWTVSCTDGSRTATSTVTVDSWWQNKTVNLHYNLMMIENGTIISQFSKSGGALTSGSEYATFITDGNYARIAYTTLDVTNYNNLVIKLRSGGISYYNADAPAIGLSTSTPTIDAGSATIGPRVAYKKLSNSTSIPAGEYSVDISSLTGTLYAFFAVSGTSGTNGTLNIIDFYAE